MRKLCKSKGGCAKPSADDELLHLSEWAMRTKLPKRVGFVTQRLMPKAA